MKKRIAIITSCLLLMLVAVGVTIAWLTDETDDVTNTFTSAKLLSDNGSFTLWEHEALLQENGTYELGAKEKDGNEYKIFPGVNVPKDPTVDIVGLEEYAYLYIKVNDELDEELSYKLDVHWSKFTDKNGDDIWTYSAGALDPSNDPYLINILKDKEIVVSEDYAAETGGQLQFKAYLVQATGFASAQEAWDNTFGK